MKNQPEINRLPFFVYGTLLPGQPNDYLWGESIVAKKPATFTSGRLYDMGSYPMLVESEEGGCVRGMLITVRAVDSDIVMARLDDLEGYDPARPDEDGYRRVQRTVQTADARSVTAWVYLGQAHTAANRPLIESGNWTAYAASKKPGLAAWWAAEDTVASLYHKVENQQ